MSNFTNVTPLFCELVKINTTSAPFSDSFPSTDTQRGLAKFLAEKCRKIGLSDVCVSEKSYVYATLPSNLDSKAVTIGLIAHMDTSSACSGENVVPKFTKYSGGDIELGHNLSLTVKEFPVLSEYVGQAIITASGNTLLGADDKAGIAEILTACEYLVNNPTVKHGDIKIAFTPDEEVGHGTDFFDVAKFGANFAYTVDGGGIGEIEYECFNAARAIFTIAGKSVHPGSAKNVMVNSILIANEIISKFPVEETPQNTEKREGFYHIDSIKGDIEQTVVDMLLRDFDKESMNRRKEFVRNLVNSTNAKYGERVKLNLYDEYSNMIEVLRDKPSIVELAKSAITECGITPVETPIRGGTDGARLSFMGLPCPNLFTGGHNFHGPYEFIPIKSMEKACAVIVKIVEKLTNI